MRTKTRLLALTIALLLGLALHAEAVPIVSISPASQDAAVGDVVVVDLIVSDLTEPIGGFSAVIDFHDGILDGLDYTIGSALGTGLDESFGFDGGSGSPLDLFFTSLESASTLDGLQGSSFVLARIRFTATSPGLSPLSLSGVVLSDVDGFEIESRTANGRVCVGGACDVPEPGVFALLALGAAGLVRRRRQARI